MVLASGALVAFGGAGGAFAADTQPVVDVVYVATAVDTSAFDSGTVTVTYTPSYDSTHAEPDLSLYGGSGTPQPISIGYTVSPQTVAAGATAGSVPPASGYPEVVTSTSASATGGVVGATASYLRFTALPGEGAAGNGFYDGANWQAAAAAGTILPTSTFDLARRSTPSLPAGFASMTDPAYRLSGSFIVGAASPANTLVFATVSAMDGVLNPTPGSTAFASVADTATHTVDIIRGSENGDLSVTPTFRMSLAFLPFVLSTTDGTASVPTGPTDPVTPTDPADPATPIAPVAPTDTPAPIVPEDAPTTTAASSTGVLAETGLDATGTGFAALALLLLGLAPLAIARRTVAQRG